MNHVLCPTALRNFSRQFAFGLFALLLVLFVGTATALAGENSVKALKQVEYTVSIPGDGVIKLCGRFGIAPEEFLKANPQVAARPDKWLYLGERVSVPVYLAKAVSPSAVADDDLIAVRMGEVRAAEDALGKAREDLAAARKNEEVLLGGIRGLAAQIEELDQHLLDKDTLLSSKKREVGRLKKINQIFLNLAIIFGAVAFVGFLAWLFQNDLKRKRHAGDMKNWEDRTYNLLGNIREKNEAVSQLEGQVAELQVVLKEAQDELAARPKVESLEDVAKLLREDFATVNVAEFFAKAVMFKDDNGNPVLGRNLSKFLESRKHLNLGELSIEEIGKIMKDELERKQKAAEGAGGGTSQL